MGRVRSAVRDRLARLRRRTFGTRTRRRDDRGRVTAEREGDVVVFVVGMRVNAFWKLHRWLPVFLVAPRMVGELRADDESGLLGSWTFLSPPRTAGFVQYWDSFDSLREYAHDGDGRHRDAWRDYYRERDDGAVGIWHETYRVAARETVYNGTPPLGLGAADASRLVPAAGSRETASGRLADSTGERAAEETVESPDA